MAINKVWQRNIATRLPRYFNVLGGQCTIVLSESILCLSKAILSAQSPFLEAYFMSSEVDQNALIAENRKAFLEKQSCPDIGLDTSSDIDEEGDEFKDEDEGPIDKSHLDDPDDDNTVIILTEYYGYDDVIQDFFRAFYSGVVNFTPATYRVTLKLACQYEVQWIIDEGCKFLEDHLKPHNFISEFKFLILMKNNQVTVKITELVKLMDFDDLIKPTGISSEWFTLDFKYLLYLLPNLRAPTEFHIFNLAFQWLEYDPSRKIKFEKTLASVSLVNLTMKFMADFVLKHSEGRYVESAPLYKMIMAAQNYKFMKEMGVDKPMKPDFKYPKIFFKRPSYRNVEEHEFTITRDILLNQVSFDDGTVKLILDPDDVTKFRFSKPCCFVYVFNGDLIRKESVRKLLIPVYPEGGSYVSDEIGILERILRDEVEEVTEEKEEDDEEEEKKDEEEEEKTTDKLNFIAVIYRE